MRAGGVYFILYNSLNRADFMGFKRYKRELYDRPKANLLPL